MKPTEMDLLQAIGKADEKLIYRTAPRIKRSNIEHKPSRIIRRSFEFAAVCAAVCIALGCGFLMKRLANQNDNLAAFTPEPEAYAAIVAFLDACKDGDQARMLDTSLIEIFSKSLYKDEPEIAEETISEYLNGFSKLRDYEIISFEDATESLDSIRQLDIDMCDLMAYKFEEKGEDEKAEEIRSRTSDSYYTHADRQYNVLLRASGIKMLEQDTKNDQWELEVVRYDGVWYAQPIEYIIPSMSEEGKEKLAAYRAADPNYSENAAE